MIAVLDYESGNLGSVCNALQRLGAEFEVTSSKGKIESADGVIFPGQGRAGPAMSSLVRSGLDKVLPELKQPFLGICLGMQLMVDELEEDNTQGLGIISGRCIRFKKISPVPHTGWNKVLRRQGLPLLEDLPDEFYQYFVHSYAVQAPSKYVYAATHYGVEFASVIAKDNFYGVQFHPEKSTDDGEKILNNFLRICGEKR